MIKEEDISFVIQGHMREPMNVQRLCDDIRKNFKGCEIIISTCDIKNNFDFDCDHLLFNKDPGKDDPKDNENHGNSKRQIYNTQRGLEKCTKKYSLKLRSDSSFINKNFLSDYDIYSVYYRIKRYKVFKERVCVLNMFTSKKHQYHYFVSDLFYFGLTEDIISIFNCPYDRYDHSNEWWSESYINFFEKEPGDYCCVEKSLCLWPAYKSGKIEKLKHDDCIEYIYTNYLIIDFDKFGFKINRHNAEFMNNRKNPDFFHQSDWIEISKKINKNE